MRLQDAQSQLIQTAIFSDDPEVLLGLIIRAHRANTLKAVWKRAGEEVTLAVQHCCYGDELFIFLSSMMLKICFPKLEVFKAFLPLFDFIRCTKNHSFD